MSREKQIEEMARAIYENTAISCVETADEIAEELYNAGYRKIDDIFEDIFEGRLEVVNKRSGDKLKKASDLAEVIFAEIEAKAPFFCENQTAYDHFYDEIAELKKKYTEGEKGDV